MFTITAPSMIRPSVFGIEYSFFCWSGNQLDQICHLNAEFCLLKVRVELRNFHDWKRCPNLQLFFDLQYKVVRTSLCCFSWLQHYWSVLILTLVYNCRVDGSLFLDMTSSTDLFFLIILVSWNSENWAWPIDSMHFTVSETAWSSTSFVSCQNSSIKW